MDKADTVAEPVTSKYLIEQQIEMLKTLLERNAITIDAYNKGMQYLTQKVGEKKTK